LGWLDFQRRLGWFHGIGLRLLRNRDRFAAAFLRHRCSSFADRSVDPIRCALDLLLAIPIAVASATAVVVAVDS
jgi:hypothetical protein